MPPSAKWICCAFFQPPNFVNAGLREEIVYAAALSLGMKLLMVNSLAFAGALKKFP